MMHVKHLSKTAIKGDISKFPMSKHRSQTESLCLPVYTHHLHQP